MMRTAWATTMLFARWRWRSIRSRIGKTGAIALLIVAAAAFIMTARTLDTMWVTAALYGPTNAIGQWATAVINDASTGSLHPTIYAALSLAVIISVTSPMISLSATTLIPATALRTLRPHPAHQFSDIAVLHACSAAGLLQLMIVTAAASILTPASQRILGIITAMLLWAILCLTASLSTHTLNTARPRGPGATLTWAATVVGVTLAALVPTSVTGPSGLIASLLAAGDSVWAAATKWLTLLALAILVTTCGTRTCASRRPTTATASTTPARFHTSSTPAQYTTPLLLLSAVVLRDITRTRVARALLGAAVVAIAAATFVPGTGSLAAAVVIPMTTALTYSINAFGVLGTALPWLSTQPGATRALPTAAVIVTAAISISINLILFPAWALHGTPLTAGAVTVLLTALTAARWSTDQAIHRPFPINSLPDHTVVPALAALAGTGRLALMCATITWTSLALSPYPGWLGAYCAFTCIWITARTVIMLTNWGHPQVHQRTIQLAHR